ncbi:MAG TPA: GNAT family N-acetyltransferase [Burkholderiales bacterium]|nr:GNAT family N-acetyltransferase [Burkholderiales bacterium]
MPIEVRTYESYAALPASFDPLFSSERSLFRSRAWLENVERHGLRPGDRLRLFAVESEGRPLALLPALYSRLYAVHPNARVLHLLQQEELPYEPLTAEGGGDAAHLARWLVGFLKAHPRSYDVVRVSPLAVDSAFGQALLAELRRSRHPVQTYVYAADRYETSAGLSFKEVMSARPRALRESLDRNTQLLLQGGRGHMVLVRDAEQLAAAREAILDVIAACGLEGDQEVPRYVPGMVAVAGAADALRLGLFFLDGAPVAMQLWVISDGRGYCMRIWGAQAQAVFPIDDVLTQLMILCLVDGDRVAELDFGPVSDAFADSWALKARARVGLAAFNARTWRGVRGAVRHVGVQALRSFPGRLRQMLAGRAGRPGRPA